MSKPEPICSMTSECKKGTFLCPLSRVVAGTPVRIKQLNGPPDVCNRLREIGLGEDRQSKLLCCKRNFICMVCNARLGISSQLADSIMVEPITAQPPVA